MGSWIDRVFRRLLVTQYFSHGWGSRNSIERLVWYRKEVNATGLKNLLDPHHPLSFGKEVVGKKLRYVSGEMESPFALLAPELMPPPLNTAKFQLVSPRVWSRNDGLRPLCIHLAGTGDHHFFRRRYCIAQPLAKREGISSIMLENPFYGTRKPATQTLSGLRNVSDLFVMGAGLMLETAALLQWAEREAFGPFCISGISLGGYMASLAASVWPKPVSVVPCLSWSTASSVYTRGVISKAIAWEILQKKSTDEELKSLVPLLDPQAVQDRKLDNSESSLADRNRTREVMGALMDTFTHLRNYPRPNDPSLAISLVADYDAYIPRDNVTDLRDIWPGVEVRRMGRMGHITGSLAALWSSTMRQAIVDSLEKNAHKYHLS